MSIKNKDGSIFKLNKPNPIMIQQDLWDDGSKFELHNFTQEEIVLHNFEEPEKKEEIKEIPKPKPIFQSLEEIIPQEIKVPIKEVKREPKKKPKNTYLFYCMPAVISSNFDPLYNENRVSITFGQQFTFEAVMVESNDLMIKIWSRKEIEKNSIIYQPSDRRWWKIEEVLEKDGFTMSCVPSSIQPSFRVQS